MKHYALLSDDHSFAFSAENPTGTRAGGSRGGDCTKLSPTVAIKAGDNREFYNGQQRFLLYRFHVPDPIHFEESFRMTIDNMGWTGPRYDDYTSVAYWYQSLPSARLKALPEDSEMCMR